MLDVIIRLLMTKSCKTSLSAIRFQKRLRAHLRLSTATGHSQERCVEQP